MKELNERIWDEENVNFNLMEVCGTHTRAIFTNGIDRLIPPGINLISGPGCPVCVTSREYIDSAITLSIQGCIIVTFGDMIRVPGYKASLEEQRAAGGDIRIVYSPLDCIKIAIDNPKKEVVFLGVGFETTSPSIALMVIRSKEMKINNLSVLLSLKRMVPVMDHLLADEDMIIDGFICPGHVSSIIGYEEFNKLSVQYRKPMVVVGFDPVDIMGGILTLINMINNNEYICKNNYCRVVKSKGNVQATEVINSVFKVSHSFWRGIGKVLNSGFEFNYEYEIYDAEKKFNLMIRNKDDKCECFCGEIIKGKCKPEECPYFGQGCTPSHPIGPCMVSMEGTCNIVYSLGGF